MPEKDLRQYQRYTARRGFPARRLELLLAQVAMVVLQSVGAKNLRLSDFLMDPKDPDATGAESEQDDAAMAEFFGVAKQQPDTPE